MLDLESVRNSGIISGLVQVPVVGNDKLLVDHQKIVLPNGNILPLIYTAWIFVPAACALILLLLHQVAPISSRLGATIVLRAGVETS